ncbi:MAG: Ig-like domain-containing protein [Planctomycetota bacterium]|nr:Ig-like domain-containing protein [Planctomycetota bacterium]
MLNALNSIGALNGNVTVTGGVGPFTLTFGKNLEGRGVSPVVASWSGGSTLATTATAGLGALLVNDVDQAHDPDWLGQVTLNVGQGVLTLGSTAGLTFLVGTGTNDRMLQFTGSLAELNAALAGLTYRGDRDYNTGDPEDGIRTDQLVVTINDLGNADLTPDSERTLAAGLTGTHTVTLTVNPMQDAPTIQGPTTASVDEDTPLVFVGHGNEVQLLTFAATLADGDRFTLTYGTNLTTNPIVWNASGATLAGNLQAALDLLFGAGNTVVTATSGAVATITFQGQLANANLTEFTASALAPSNGTVAPSTLTEGSGNEVQTLTLGGESGTVMLSFGGANGAVLTAPYAGLQVSELQANLDGIAGLAGNVLALGATGGPFTLVYGNVLAGRNLPLLGTTVTDAAAAAATSVSDGVRVDMVQTLTLGGASGNVTLWYDGVAGTAFSVVDQPNVQAALDSIPALNGNVTVTGSDPFMLSFGTGLEGRSVSPVVASWSGGSTLSTVATTGLGALLVNDVDQPYDPDWLGQVTLDVGQGVLTLGSTAGLTFLVGTGTNDRTLRFTGALANLNAALAGLTYRGDRDYNLGDPDDGMRTDQLVLTINDSGNSNLTPEASRVLDALRTVRHTVTLTVNPVQDAPTIQGPTTASVNEDTSLVFAVHRNEVQQLALAGAIAGDTFTLTYGTNLTTNPIAWNASGATLAANVQAALDLLLGAGNTVVTVSGGSATITFQGKLASANLAQFTASRLTLSNGTVTPSTLTQGSGNEVQTLTLGGASGTATLSFGGVSGAAVTAPYTGLQVSELQANLEGIPELAGNVLVLGALGGPFTVVYGNGLAGRNLPLLGTAVTGFATATVAPVSNGVRVDAVQTLNLSGASGSVTLWYEGVSGTTTVPAAAYTLANVQAALNSIGALNGNVTVTGAGPFTLTFGGGLEGRGVSPVVAAWTGGSTLATTATAGLGALLVNDVDQAYDPDWLGQVTLTVGQGVLTLGSTAGLTFLVGTGTNDRLLQFTGALANVNAALAGLTYRADRDFNLGDPDDGMRTDQLVVTIDDLGNTDLTPDSIRTLVAGWTSTHTVMLTVNPVQDAPTIQGPTTASVDEDTTLVFAGHGSEVQQLTFDNLHAEETFTLTYGTNLTTDPIFWDADGATLAADVQAALDTLLGAGNTVVTASSGALATITFQGKLANANLMQLTASSLAPPVGTVTPSTLTEGSGNEVQTLTLGGASGTATLSFGGASGAVLTAPYAGLQASELQANLEGIPGLVGNVWALGAMGGPFTVVFGNGLAGRNLPLLGTAVTGSATAAAALVSDGVRVDAVQTLTLSGASGSVTLSYDGVAGTAFSTYALVNVQTALNSIPALNGNVTVTGSGSGPFTLTFGKALEGRTVSPVVAAWSGGSTLATTATTGLGALLVNDVDQAYDPDWLGQVTLTVSHGLLNLGSTAGLTILVGTGTNDRTVQFTGALADLNAALAGLTYRGDQDYNTGDPRNGIQSDRLVLTINDLGNADLTPDALRSAAAGLTATQTVTLTVNPKHDTPNVSVLPPAQVVDEDQVLKFPAFSVFDVDARNLLTNPTLVYDPDWQGKVTLAVSYGTLWLNDATGVTYTGDRTRTVTLTGGLNALNNALRLQNVRYQGDANFNSRNRAPDPLNPLNDAGATDSVPNDTLTITIDDLLNTDIASPNITVTQTASNAVGITVNAKQDAPELPTVPGPQVVDEDQMLTLTTFSVFDVDARSRTTDPHAFEYDPDWQGTVTLTVSNGTVWLNDGGIDIGGPYVTYGGDHTRVVTITGGLDALNKALLDKNVRYQGDLNFNTGRFPENLVIQIIDSGYTDILGTGLSTLNATRTVPITVRPINDLPTIVIPGDMHNVLDEDSPLGVALRSESTGITVGDVDDINDPATIELQVVVHVRHGGLTLSNTGGLARAVLTAASASGQAPFRLDTYERIELQGTIANLNTVLATLVYFGDKDFNTGAVPEVLDIEVNDLGNTDYRTTAHTPASGQVVTDSRTITVEPINDAPTITVPSGLLKVVDEDAAAGLGLVDASSRGIVVDDIDRKCGLLPSDPDGKCDLLDLGAPVRLQVTVSVLHGGLVLTPPATVTIDQRVSVLTPPDDVEAPLQADTYQSWTLTGPIDDLNTALATLRYYGDEHFNTGTLPEVLTIGVNDLAYTDKATVAHVWNDPKALTAVTSITLTVQPINQPPTIQIPADLVPAKEDDANGQPVVNSTGVGITVGDVDDLYDPAVVQLQVTVSVLHGGLLFWNSNGVQMVSQTLASTTGQEPFRSNTYESITVQGSIANLNVALASLRYFGDANFNTGTLAEMLTVSVNDLGYTDKDTRAHLPTDWKALTTADSVVLTVLPTNDAPTIAVPANLNRSVGEDAPSGLLLVDTTLGVVGIRVDDLVDDIQDRGDIQLHVTLTVQHGGLTINPATVIETVLASADGVYPVHPDTYQQLILRGTIADLNQALTSLTYYGDKGFQTTTAPETLTVLVNDMGNTDYRTPGYPDYGVSDPLDLASRVSTNPNVTVPPRLSATKTLALTVTARTTNDPPIAVNDSFSTAEDTPLTVAATELTKNDLPGPLPQEASQHVRIVSSGFGVPSHGSLYYDGVKLIYTPNANWNGTDTFSYTIDDGDPTSTAQGTVSIMVTPVDDPPTAGNDAISTTENTPVTVSWATLKINDIPGPPDEVTAGQSVRLQPSGFGTPAHGSVSYDAPNAKVIYTPAADFFGTDTFTYTIDDGRPAFTALGTVTVTVQPVNNPPVVGDDLVLTAEDTPLTVAASVLLSNDRPGPANENGQTLQIVFVLTAAHGAVTLEGTNVVYRPAADFNGTDTFRYRVQDNGQSWDANSSALVSDFLTAEGTVTVTVTAVDDPPTARNDAAATNEDTPATIAVPTLLSNDIPGPPDEEAAGQRVRIVANGFSIPAYGTVAYDSVNANVIYTPQPDFHGTDTFTYTIDDGRPNSTALGTVTVTVAALNDAPVRTAGTTTPVTVLEDSANSTAVTLGLGGLTYAPGPATATDEAGQTLTFQVVAIPAFLTVWDGNALVSAGTTLADLAALRGLKYRTVDQANGTGNLTWTVTDSGSGTAPSVKTLTETLAVTVTAVNDRPERISEAPVPLSVLEDCAGSAAVTLGLGGLIYAPGPTAATDESGQPLTYRIMVIPAFLTVWLENGTTRVTPGTLLADLPALQGLKYKTVADANGTGNLTWTVTDSGSGSAPNVNTLTETLAVSVTAVNDAPVRTAGTPAAINVNEDNANSTAVTLGLSGLNYAAGPATATDEVGQQTLTYQITSIPAFVTLWLMNGSTQVTTGTALANLADLTALRGLKVKTVADANGTDFLVWTVTDSGSGTGTNVNTLPESLAITVNAVNDPPVATNDTLLTTEVTPVTVAASVLTSNDRPGPTNESSQTLRLVVGGFGTPAHGTVAYDGVNVIYTPAANFIGSDQFTYTITDNGVSPLTAVGTVLVTVTSSAAAEGPYQNPIDAHDVDGNGNVAPLDVLIIINYLNLTGVGGEAEASLRGPPYLDVDGDHHVTPSDVLTIIQELNFLSGGIVEAGEGEAAVAPQAAMAVAPVALFVGPASGLAIGSVAGLGEVTEASFGSRVTAEAAGLYSRPMTPPDSAPLSRQPAALYDDVDLDRFAIEQALAEMAGEFDQTAGEAATDRLFASLSG